MALGSIQGPIKGAKNSYTGTTTNSFVEVASFKRMTLALFAIMKNDGGANGLKWRIRVQANRNGFVRTIYGAATIAFGNTDHDIENGAFAEWSVEVKSESAGNSTTYELQTAHVKVG